MIKAFFPCKTLSIFSVLGTPEGGIQCEERFCDSFALSDP